MTPAQYLTARCAVASVLGRNGWHMTQADVDDLVQDVALELWLEGVSEESWRRACHVRARSRIIDRFRRSKARGNRIAAVERATVSPSIEDEIEHRAHEARVALARPALLEVVELMPTGKRRAACRDVANAVVRTETQTAAAKRLGRHSSRVSRALDSVAAFAAGLDVDDVFARVAERMAA